jgi:hypothetical protein
VNGHINKDLIGALGGSGFPFQTAVAAAITGTGLFDVQEEVAWNAPDRSTAFLDIVASTQNVRICIECKWLRKEKLIFLLPSHRSVPPTDNLNLVFVNCVADSTRRPVVSYGQATATPMTEESVYCVVDSSNRNERMIEKEVQPLVQGTAAYAMDSVRGFSGMHSLMFVPVFVTTAKLYVASYDSKILSLEDGIYKGRAEDIRPVPCIRFTKQFTGSQPPRSRLRTVLVLQAEHLLDFIVPLGNAGVPQGGSTTIFDPSDLNMERRWFNNLP